MEEEKNLKPVDESQEVKIASIYNGLFKEHTLKLDIGAITKSGKFVVFDNLKKYKFNSLSNKYDNYRDYKYLIFEYKGENKPSDTDLDDYRSLVTQPYNVYSSKVSGNLALIAELCQFNDFDLSIKNITTEGENSGGNKYKIYNPTFNFGYEGNYEHIPYGAECKFEMTWNNEYKGEEENNSGSLEWNYSYEIDAYQGEKTYSADGSGYSPEVKNKHDYQRYNQLINNKGLQYQFDVDGILSKEDNVIWRKITNLAELGYFNDGNRNTGGKIRYEITPSMNWGKVEYLKVIGEIDLDKIGTGYINLSTWKYYNSDNLCTLVWGLDIYEEDGFAVDGVDMDLLRIISVDEDNVKCEILSYDTGARESWFGTFTENIPLDLNYSKIRTEENIIGQLKSNQLYLVRIRVYYIPTKDINEHENREAEVRVFYRFLYTCGIFNQYYQTTRDYVSLQPNFNLKLESQINLGISDNFSSLTREGILRTTDLSDEAKSKESSFSAIQNRYDVIVDGDIVTSLEKDYNEMFYVDMSLDNNEQKDDSIFALTKDNESISIDSSYDQQVNTDEKESEYLATSTLNLGSDSGDEFDNYILKYREQYGDNEDMFFWYDADGAAILKPTSILKCFETSFDNSKCQVVNNKIAFHIGYNLLNTVKGYATKKEGSMAGYSCFHPIAYDKYTFSKYGLEISDNEAFANDYEEDISLQNASNFSLFKDVPEHEIWIPSHVCLFGFTNADCKLFVKDIGKKYFKTIQTDELYTTKFSKGVAHNKRFSNVDTCIDDGGHNDYSWHWQTESRIAGANPYSDSYYANFYIYYFGYTDYPASSSKFDDSVLLLTHVFGNTKTRSHARAFYCRFCDGGSHLTTDDPYVILLLLQGENQEICSIPINMLDQRYYTKTNNNFNEYPGMSMRYGFSHIFAQILNNIWVYSNRENITLQAYIVNDYFWNNTYVFNLNDNLVLTYDIEDIDNRAFYLVLDDGKILLSDFVDTVYESKEGKKFLISGSNNAQIDYTNITKQLNSDGETVVPFEIKIDESDICELMRKLLKDATEFLDGIIFDYDGTTIAGYSDYAASEGELLEFTSDYKILPITYFNPIALEYSKNGTCCGPKLTVLGKNILLDKTIGTTDDDGYIISGEQILNNFTYKEGRFCLRDGYTTGNGDYGNGVLLLLLAILGNKGKSDKNFYMTGFVDAPLLPSLRIF